MAIEKKEYSGTLAADGDTEEVVGQGPCTFVFDGTFGGGTVTLYHYVGGAYVPITDDSTDKAFTADGSAKILYDIGVQWKVKATLASSTSPSIKYRIAFQSA